MESDQRDNWSTGDENGTKTPTPAAVITPWEVRGRIDYAKLVDQTGCSAVDAAVIERIEKLSGRPAHPWLKRGLFFAHRGLDDLLDAVEAGQPFYLYTRRGPSSESLHLGHMIPFLFCRYLQEAFGVPLVVQMADDAKFLYKGVPINETRRLARENARDIIAAGLDVDRTFLFANTDYMGSLYPNVVRLQSVLPADAMKRAFGLSDSDNVGTYSFPAIQAAPAFSSSMPDVFGSGSDVPCLVVCAIDQDAFFSMTRDLAPKLDLEPPAVVYSRFLPALQGIDAKMSASVLDSAIFMNDTTLAIGEKVRKHAFSGGRPTLAQHQSLGGDCDVDVAYQYLSVFCLDDARLDRIRDDYTHGRMTSAQIKDEMVDVVSRLVINHQIARAAVTDDVVDAFFSPRPLLS
ncbi:Tyrosine-tRNA ligase [Pandoravirus salinus]|uniref:tryptophan--tRNA ligase n=1 Tax=Pandoravirus salinus TaxID=1349410 RepID=S4VXS4_9VIRU|nr:Tyrosine-tRNA ligase [Pandoravirus salinus]AGO85168.1 Tyrosine-tRNA ligase [Pandoravirus salinus]